MQKKKNKDEKQKEKISFFKKNIFKKIERIKISIKKLFIILVNFISKS